MLKDLTRQYSIIHIAGREYKIRYSLNCLLCLETMYKPLGEILKTKYSKWGIEDVLQLTHAAMCDLPQNRKAVSRRRFDLVKPTLQELGEKIDPHDLPTLRTELVRAIINSMPQSSGESKDAPPLREQSVRAMYVDVMGRPEREFWNSTYKDIITRPESYLEAKGLKEPPQYVKALDD